MHKYVCMYKRFSKNYSNENLNEFYEKLYSIYHIKIPPQRKLRFFFNLADFPLSLEE